nr:hypothetical protein [Paraburkholderia elongata]
MHLGYVRWIRGDSIVPNVGNAPVAGSMWHREPSVIEKQQVMPNGLEANVWVSFPERCRNRIIVLVTSFACLQDCENSPQKVLISFHRDPLFGRQNL